MPEDDVQAIPRPYSVRWGKITKEEFIKNHGDLGHCLFSVDIYTTPDLGGPLQIGDSLQESKHIFVENSKRRLLEKLEEVTGSGKITRNDSGFYNFIGYYNFTFDFDGILIFVEKLETLVIDGRSVVVDGIQPNYRKMTKGEKESLPKEGRPRTYNGWEIPFED